MRLLSQVRALVVPKLSLLLAGVLIVASSIGCMYFFSTSVLPILQTREQVSAKLTKARESLDQSRQLQSESSESLQKRLSAAQATLAASYNLFLADAQASQVINAVYQCASVSGVTITNLDTKPLTSIVPVTVTPTAKPTATLRPTQVPTTTGGTGTPSTSKQAPNAGPAATLPVPSPAATIILPKLFYTTTLHTRVQGDARRLLDFGARLRDISEKGFAVSNVKLTNGNPQSVLTLDISLYTSPFASKDAIASNPSTPAALADPGTPAAPAAPPDSSPTSPPVVTVVVVRVVTATPSSATLAPTTAVPIGRAYVVQRGDTLFSIARRYGVTLQALALANHLASYSIQTGQQLVIPTN